MVPKSGSSRRFSALLLLFLTLVCLPLLAQKRESTEGHLPRTRTAEKATETANARKELGEEDDRENPRERQEWFMRGRLYKGKAAPQLLMRAQRQRDALRKKAIQAKAIRAASQIGATAQSSTQNGWTELGPSPLRSVTTTGDDQDYGFVTGRVTSIAVDQNDPTGNTVYIGGALGGVWKSTNAANRDVTNVVWKAITDDQPTLAAGAIAIDPADSNIVLVGTGEANSSSDSYYGLGILRSTDGGNSWALISSANNGQRPFQGLAFAKIAFNSDNPSVVVAASAASSEGIIVGAEQPANDNAMCQNPSATATCRGLYYSYDSGQTWSQSIMVDPAGTPDNGSASSVIYNSAEKNFYAWSRAHGLYTSADGITFTRAADSGAGTNGVVQPAAALSLANCPTSPVNLQTCPMYRGEISVVHGRDEMYVWFVDSSTTPVNGGIYQTKDGGRSWTKLSTAGIDNCGDSLGCGTEQGDYNLVLTAVPSGASGTDLYAGAINIYRCQITTNNPTCAAKPFVNLTHVYGCTPTGSFSKVHPDQHAVNYSVANPGVIYFGNDGGIYRTIASQNGAVVPSSCQPSPPSQPYYPFENLNGTMGSMTQFVWFQQHPTDEFTMLGGTQDNGSPAIDGNNSGTNGMMWRSVLGGDGGFTEINPSNANEWFAENTHVSIQRCNAGTNCTDSQFTQVISSPKLGGDSAAFYMPFMLDPRNSSQIILGTCRVWRVPSSGLGVPASPLSQTFDASNTCSSSSPSLVSAVAAGGPQNVSGSSVIYAGTADGQIYTTANALNAQTNWLKASGQPGFSNPKGYPISGFAIDPNVAAGTTVYATVMGFQTGHVFQTTNGGASWVDVTGNLPDSPANGVAIEASAGTLYVATDVGVFSTSTVNGPATHWAEVGPATGPGTLPNVAVTRVAIFHPDGQPARLRVSTYGRGIWEMLLPGSTEPDFAVNVSNPDLVTSPLSSVSYTGTLSYFNGYSGNVVMSCAAAGGAVPSKCEVGSMNNGTFTVTAADNSAQDFSFRVQGSDGTLVRQAAVTLRVVDFSLGTPTPPSVVNLVHGNQATIQLPLTALGSFNRTVSLDCDSGTLPSGMTCLTSPVLVTPGGTLQVSVTFDTTITTPAGTYMPTIRATAVLDSTHSITHTQTISVQVTAKAGFAIDTSSYTKQTVTVGQPITAMFSITPHDDYAGTVLMHCSSPGSGISPGSCAMALSPSGAATSSAGVIGTNPIPVYVTLDTRAGVAGSQQLDITVTDSNQLTSNHVSLPFALTDFSLAALSSPIGSPGKRAQFTYTLVPLNGYSHTVNLTCDASSLGAVPCTISPGNSVRLAAGQSTTVSASFIVPNTIAAGSYPVAVTATDSVISALSHTQTGSLNVQLNPDFDFSFGASTVSAAAGAPILPVPVTVSARGGFNGSVDWGVAGCPSLATCTVSPNPTIAGQTANLTITTAAPYVSGLRRSSMRYLVLWLGLPFGIVGLVSRKRKTLAASLLLLLGLAACGGGTTGSQTSPPITHPGTPAGTYTIVVTGTAGTTVHSQNFTLTVQ